jgi:uncharacterized protein YgbK (DUF1537 family)
MATRRKKSLLLSFYGDDFTGTTATAEALALSGVPTITFANPPRLPFLKKHFPGVQAVGVAGISRSLSTEKLDPFLKPIFKKMNSYGTRLFLYKVCSTFDSSPTMGSIGKAIEIGMRIFSHKFVPILPAAPRLGRYTLFGHHFVHLAGEVYRLDRHPSMSNHPSTPMREADLRRHLAEQTILPCGLITARELERGKERVDRRIQDLLRQSVSLILFDTLTNRHLNLACSVIWDHTEKGKTLFAVGSQEWGYGLAQNWKRLGLLHPAPKAERLHRFQTDKRLLVVSGSCASMTGRQIEWAVNHGFKDVAVQPVKLLNEPARSSEKDRILQQAAAILEAGKSLIVHTALGPEDPRIPPTRRETEALGLSTQTITDVLGQALSVVTKSLLKTSRIRRLVLAGGDISGKIANELGIWALQVASPVGIAAPLCYAYSSDRRVMGLQIAMKGGQIGDDAYFESARTKRIPEFREASMGRF